jgi:hypothetical protein
MLFLLFKMHFIEKQKYLNSHKKNNKTFHTQVTSFLAYIRTKIFIITLSLFCYFYYYMKKYFIQKHMMINLFIYWIGFFVLVLFQSL